MLPYLVAVLAMVVGGLAGETAEARGDRVTGVFFIEHGRHMVGTMSVASGVIGTGGYGHSSRHCHLSGSWLDGDGFSGHDEDDFLWFGTGGFWVGGSKWGPGSARARSVGTEVVGVVAVLFEHLRI